MPGQAMLLLSDRLPWIAAALLIGAFVLMMLGIATPDELVRAGVRRSVVLVDDEPEVRLALRRLIESRTALKVVGEASNGSEGLAVVDAVVPDIVVMDVTMPVLDGVQATRRIREMHPYIKVLGFSSADDDPTGAIMRYAGAAGYMVKGDPPDAIVNTLLTAA